MRRTRAIILILSLILLAFASITPLSAINAPDMTILALSLTFDLVIFISACATVVAIVCICIKMRNRNNKNNKLNKY